MLAGVNIGMSYSLARELSYQTSSSSPDSIRRVVLNTTIPDTRILTASMFCSCRSRAVNNDSSHFMTSPSLTSWRSDWSAALNAYRCPRLSS